MGIIAEILYPAFGFWKIGITTTLGGVLLMMFNETIIGKG
jgi:hypothetical protein